MCVYGLSTKFTIDFKHIPYLTYNNIHKCSSLSPWYS